MPGITIAEHPWERMMAGKKPAPEPLAKLVPHDNYYLSFKSMRKLIELSDLMDQWGTGLHQAPTGAVAATPLPEVPKPAPPELPGFGAPAPAAV